jgi:hypothetical protein
VTAPWHLIATFASAARSFAELVHEIPGIGGTEPADVLEETTALAARIAVAEGHGETVLLALTGRARLPSSFSAV